MVAPGLAEIEIATKVEQATVLTGTHDYSAQSVRAQISSGPATAKAWRLYVQSSTPRLERHCAEDRINSSDGDTVGKVNHQLVQDLGPVRNRHCPFGGNVRDGPN